VHYFHACTGSQRITPPLDIHHPTHLMVCETRGIRLCTCFASHLRCSWRTQTTYVYTVCVFTCLRIYIYYIYICTPCKHSAVALEFLRIGRWNPHTAAASPSTPLQSRRQMLLASARNFLAIKQPRRSTSSRDTDQCVTPCPFLPRERCGPAAWARPQKHHNVAPQASPARLGPATPRARACLLGTPTSCSGAKKVHKNGSARQSGRRWQETRGHTSSLG